MIFTSSAPVAAPRDFVFARACEFDRLARAVEGRGAQVREAFTPEGAPRYEIQYPFRQAMWPAALELKATNPPDTIDVAIEAAAVLALAEVAFLEGEGAGSRVELKVTMSPRTMQGRLFLGSLHVVRGRVQERLDEDLAALARGAEALWRAHGA